MKNVEGKVIIITGASSGIGEETARVLAENGAKVVLSARREERLAKLASELGQDNVAYLKSDVTSLEDMQALVALAQERFGKVDTVFANAVLYAVSQPDNVDVSNLVVQPTMEN